MFAIISTVNIEDRSCGAKGKVFLFSPPPPYPGPSALALSSLRAPHPQLTPIERKIPKRKIEALSLSIESFERI